MLRLWLGRGALLSTIVFIITTLALIFINAFVLNQSQSLSFRADRARETISQRRQEESIYIVILDKLNFIEETLFQRFPYATTINNIDSVVKSGTSINSLAIAQQEIKINLVVSSPLALESFIENILKHPEFAPYSIALQGTSRAADGSYVVSFLLKGSSLPP